MNQFMAYLYPNRADNEAYINEEIDLRPIEAYLTRKNEGRTEDKYTYFHIICAAVVKAFVLRPKMNRFISGNRMYQRKFLSVAFVVKKKFSDRSEEGLAFRKFDDDSTIDKLHESLCQEIHTQRRENVVDNSTHFMGILLKFPRFILRAAIGLLRIMDYYGWIPQKLLDVSPFHGSMIITDLGSLRLGPVYHHIYNFGTLPVFIAFGPKRHAYELDRRGNVVSRKYVDAKAVVDEGIVDGHYYAQFFQAYQYMFAHPEILETPPTKVVEDIF